MERRRHARIAPALQVWRSLQRSPSAIFVAIVTAKQWIDEMIDTYELLQRRFPILEVVVRNLSCDDGDKQLLRELFLTVYSVGYEDAQESIK